MSTLRKKYKKEAAKKPSIQVQVKKNVPSSVANISVAFKKPQQTSDSTSQAHFKPKAKKETKTVAFASFELTSKSNDAKIIQLNKLVPGVAGDQEFSFLFSNCGVPIDPIATAHHGIVERDVANKKPIAEFNLCRETFFSVWDGRVFSKLLWVNGVEEKPKLINLHFLSRFIMNDKKPIKLATMAAIAMPDRKNTISFYLKDLKNKVRALPKIHAYIKAELKKRYGEDSDTFMSVISKCRDFDGAEKAVQKFLKKKNEIRSAASQSKHKHHKQNRAKVET